MTTWAFRSATELAAAIRDREVSSVELLEYYLERVDRLNEKINAVVVDDRERARTRAQEADAALERGEIWGPLHGVPMTCKESYDVEGLPTTFGNPEFKDNIATSDAVAIERLKAAGVVLFGKTNVPLALADFQSYNDIYGTTSNPYDTSRGPGGSSGGSAAALAAGLVGLETGSDIGGSIRNPAHFCGVFGHKPTWNLLPPRGHSIGDVVSPTDIAVIGPLARSAKDLEIAVQAMAGPDEHEARGMRSELTRTNKPVNELRVAVWSNDGFAPVTAESQRRVELVAQAFTDAGATVDHEARPGFTPEHTHRTYQSLLWSAMAARMPDEAFTDLVAQAAALDDDDHGERATMLRAQTIHHRSWVHANEVRNKLRWEWHRFFGQWDLLLTPMMASPAFEHDQQAFGKRTIDVDGADQPYFQQLFWAGLTCASYLPSTVVPTGLDGRGLPIGVQIAGAEYADLDTIAAAQWLEGEGVAKFEAPADFVD